MFFVSFYFRLADRRMSLCACDWRWQNSICEFYEFHLIFSVSDFPFVYRYQANLFAHFVIQLCVLRQRLKLENFIIYVSSFSFLLSSFPSCVFRQWLTCYISFCSSIFYRELWWRPTVWQRAALLLLHIIYVCFQATFPNKQTNN